MDPDCFSCDGFALRFPRPRGDGPGITVSDIVVQKVPPPTRGWTRLRIDISEVAEGSPAHAGMDPLSPAPIAATGWFPRPRGDGPSLG